MVRLAPDNLSVDRAALHRGRRARRWFAAEVDNLLARVGPGPSVGPTAADGGQPIDHLHLTLEHDAWRHVAHELFGCEG
jgi:hypothetical protein